LGPRQGYIAKTPVAGYSPDSNDVRTEDVEPPLVETVTRERLVETEGWKRLSRCCVVYGVFRAVIICCTVVLNVK
jgi:hypothetical protein